MDETTLLISLAIVVGLAFLAFSAIALNTSRKPKIDRDVVEGTIVEVFKGGRGVRVAYNYKGRQWRVLQINSGVNQLPFQPFVGAKVSAHVNPYRPSNLTLTPRPVRDERALMTALFVFFGAVVVSVIFAMIGLVLS